MQWPRSDIWHLVGEFPLGTREDFSLVLNPQKETHEGGDFSGTIPACLLALLGFIVPHGSRSGGRGHLPFLL